MATERRTGHPFYMYDAILGETGAFPEVVRANETVVDRFAAEIASSGRLFLVGIGTSHHAAQVGEHFVRVYGGGLPVQALHSFDFALYGPELAERDCVVVLSHRGGKRFSLEALRRAREAGCRTALIAGEGEVAGAAHADVTFRTVGQDRSSAHTISYVGALAVLALLAERVGRHRTGSSLLERDFLTDELPEALRACLSTEGEMGRLAGEHRDHRRYWLAGGGPSAITAQEIALKIKETSYLQAEGMSTEAMLHGPFQCVEPDDLFILIAPAGAAQARTVELAGLVREIGAPYLVVGDGTPEELGQAASGWCVIPPVPEPFTALTCLLPLQLLTYHLALARGTNPDGFRLEDPRFARASKLVRL